MLTIYYQKMCLSEVNSQKVHGFMLKAVAGLHENCSTEL